MATEVYHKRDLYKDVTARILAELEAGAPPWIKPWSATPGRKWDLPRQPSMQGQACS